MKSIFLQKASCAIAKLILVPEIWPESNEETFPCSNSRLCRKESHVREAYDTGILPVSHYTELLYKEQF